MTSRVKLQSESSRSKTALLLGTGYVARAMAPHLQTLGYKVSGTYHRKQYAIKDVQMIPFDSDATVEAFEDSNIVISSIPPSNGGDPALTALEDAKCTADWIGYLSATSVYGDRGGQWAFEDEPPNPSLDRGRRRADAEIDWIETGWPVHIFRLAGIYGLGRAPFDKIRNGKAKAIIKPGHIVNRIHVDDICSALLASIQAPNPQRIYNVADGNPAPPQDVLDYAASLIDAPKPDRVNLSRADISDMARSFYSESKRIDNSRTRRDLKWSPEHPTYKEGLSAILKHQG